MSNNGIGAVVSAGILGVVFWAFKRQQKEQQIAAQPAVVKRTVATGPEFKDLALGQLVSFGIDTFSDWSNSRSTLAQPVTTTQAAMQRAGTTTARPVTRPANGSGIGPNGVDFDAYEAKYNLPAGYLKRTGQIESNLNPKAKNPNSSAGGLFQFINATAADYGLVDRYDPEQATDAAARLARDNANRLRPVLGREPTAAELYLAHQQGGSGASKLLRNPNVPANSVVSSNAVKLNGGSTSMTAGEFAGLWINKFNKGFQ